MAADTIPHTVEHLVILCMYVRIFFIDNNQIDHDGPRW